MLQPPLVAEAEENQHEFQQIKFARPSVTRWLRTGSEAVEELEGSSGATYLAS